MGKCALAGRECPRTNDPNARWYCPLWTNGTVMVNPNEDKRKVVYCAAELIEPGFVGLYQSLDRPAESAEQTRDIIAKGFQTIIGMLAKMTNLKLGPKQLDHHDVK